MTKKVVKKADTSSEESEEEVKPQKKVNKAAKKVSSSEESEEEQPKVAVKARKASKEVKKIQPVQEDSESEEKPRVQTRKASGDKLAGKKAQNGDAGDEEGEFEVKVAGLSFNAYDEDVRSFFDQCGNVISVNLLTRPDGKPRGLGFIKFSKKSSFNKAIALNGSEHMGRTLNIEESYGKNNNQGGQRDNNRNGQPQGEANIETPTLFIGGLSYNSTRESIMEFFAGVGEVLSARIVTDKETGNVIIFLFSQEDSVMLSSMMSRLPRRLTNN